MNINKIHLYKINLPQTMPKEGMEWTYEVIDGLGIFIRNEVNKGLIYGIFINDNFPENIYPNTFKTASVGSLIYNQLNAYNVIPGIIDETDFTKNNKLFYSKNIENFNALRKRISEALPKILAKMLPRTVNEFPEKNEESLHILEIPVIEELITDDSCYDDYYDKLNEITGKIDTASHKALTILEKKGLPKGALITIDLNTDKNTLDFYIEKETGAIPFYSHKLGKVLSVYFDLLYDSDLVFAQELWHVFEEISIPDFGKLELQVCFTYDSRSLDNM